MTGNASSIVQFTIQIKNGMMKYVNVSEKVIALAKYIIIGILAYLRMVSI